MLTFIIFQASAVISQLIQNGDFEYGIGLCKPAPLYSCNSADPSGISPWYVSSAISEYQINFPGLFVAFSGVASMSLNTNSTANGSFPYTLGQNVATPLNSVCTVTFQLSENSCGPLVKTGFIQAAGNSTLSFSHSIPLNGTGYSPVSYSFAVVAVTTLIEIGSTTANTSCGPIIDAVAMSCLVPAISTTFNSPTYSAATTSRAAHTSAANGLAHYPSNTYSSVAKAAPTYGIASSAESKLVLPLLSAIFVISVVLC